jgi:hypothetical protein
MRHQGVTTFFSSNRPVVPLRFGVLYSTTGKIETMLEEHAA